MIPEFVDDFLSVSPKRFSNEKAGSVPSKGWVFDFSLFSCWSGVFVLRGDLNHRGRSERRATVRRFAFGGVAQPPWKVAQWNAMISPGLVSNESMLASVP